MAASIGALRGKVYIVLEGKALEDAIEVGEVEVPISVSFTPQKPGPTYRGHVGPGSDGGAMSGSVVIGPATIPAAAKGHPDNVPGGTIRTSLGDLPKPFSEKDRR